MNLKKSIPISQHVFYDKIIDDNKRRLIEYALGPCKHNLGVSFSYSKVKEIEYSQFAKSNVRKSIQNHRRDLRARLRTYGR